MKNPKAFTIAILIFIGCLMIGLGLAHHRMIWTDECFSQEQSVHRMSYADQFLGRITEGGNAPLFYSIQKLFLQLIHYHMPTQWTEGQYSNDISSQVILRISPIFFMSLSIAVLFYYFSRRYSCWVGFLNLFICLSSFMLWDYWAEARPYALLIFLTTIQSLVFLKILDQKSDKTDSKWWVGLGVINILLSLTSILSLGAILAISAVWWFLKERDWRKYIFVTLMPFLIVLFYYIHAPHYQFFFDLSPGQLIYCNITRERLGILFIFLILVLINFWDKNRDKAGEFLTDDILKPLPYIVFMVLVLMASIGVLCLFGLHKGGQGQLFSITSRYFIYLTPIGIIGTTLMSVALANTLPRHSSLRWSVIGIIALMIIGHLGTIPVYIYKNHVGLQDLMKNKKVKYWVSVQLQGGEMDYDNGCKDFGEGPVCSNKSP